jgi:hypothetical protein
MRKLGRSGPANSRRMPLAASRLNSSPGRMRTTDISGFSSSTRSRILSTADLWRE